MAPLVRGLLVIGVVALVLGAAWIIIKGPDTSTDVAARSHQPPVAADLSLHPVSLGHGHAALAGGPLGLWATSARPGRSPGELLQLDTTDGHTRRSFALPVSPQSLAVGRHVIWVLGTDPAMPRVATLVRFDPATRRIVTRALDEPSSCHTNRFASCYPVAVRGGVWVPLSDKVVHVSDKGSIPDRAAQASGHVWDVAAGAGQLWVVAESGVDRVNPQTARVVQRISLKREFGPGMKSNHIVASGRDVWVSSFPRVSSQPSGLITRINPRGDSPQVSPPPITFPGAGALALQGTGLWVERFNGQGELDRLNAADGALTGPFEVVPDDVTRIVVRGPVLWLLSYRADGNRRTVTKMTLTPAR